MHRLILPFAATLWAFATQANAAGLQFIDVPASRDGPALVGTVWSPCEAPTAEVRIRGRAFPGTKDCPVAGDKLPLVVVSHGRTGSSGGHHDTTAALADAGFIVAAINHPIDSNASQTRRVEDIAYLTDRPADIKRLIDFMLDASPLAAKIDRERIGFFGFSRGGYTGLVLIGGEPSGALAQATCGPRSTNSLCLQIREGKFPTQGYVHDTRIKAAVLADSAPNFFFSPDQLKNVRVPVQLWASEHGGQGATAQATVDISNALAAKTNVNIVRSAAHFVFLAPCSAEEKTSNAELCVDADGFDRVAFHKQFNADVVAFFRKRLGGQ